MLTDKQAEEIKKALENLVIAEVHLKLAAKSLADEFGNNIPSMSAKVTKMFCESINEINKNMQFAMSFVRVSIFQQIVKPKQETTP